MCSAQWDQIPSYEANLCLQSGDWPNVQCMEHRTDRPAELMDNSNLRPVGAMKHKPAQSYWEPSEDWRERKHGSEPVYWCRHEMILRALETDHDGNAWVIRLLGSWDPDTWTRFLLQSNVLLTFYIEMSDVNNKSGTWSPWIFRMFNCLWYKEGWSSDRGLH